MFFGIYKTDYFSHLKFREVENTKINKKGVDQTKFDTVQYFINFIPA